MSIKSIIEEIEKKKVNEEGVTATGIGIADDLSRFINDIVIPKSGGYISNERDGALLLLDILKDRYDIFDRSPLDLN